LCFTNDSLGVGGWADSGIDPALYANKLMQGARLAVDKNLVDPSKILHDAYDFAKDVVGSSTACIVSVDGKRLTAANLGECVCFNCFI
jgi:protein phosphatase PTC7